MDNIEKNNKKIKNFFSCLSDLKRVFHKRAQYKITFCWSRKIETLKNLAKYFFISKKKLFGSKINGRPFKENSDYFANPRICKYSGFNLLTHSNIGEGGTPPPYLPLRNGKWRALRLTSIQELTFNYWMRILETDFSSSFFHSQKKNPQYSANF